MSLTAVNGFTLLGTSALPVTVEVDILRRLPQVVIVGLPSNHVRETAERIRCAFQVAGFEFPRQRVVVSCAPADLRKEANGLDLAIAVGILVASGQIPAPPPGWAFLGELSLNGAVRSVRGGLAAARALPHDDAHCGVLVGSPEIALDACRVCPGAGRGLDNLADLRLGWDSLTTPNPAEGADGATERRLTPDFSDVRGNQHAIPLLLKAARDRTPVILRGNPGTGKTMIAARMAGLLPDLTPTEALEVATIHDAAGLRAPGTALATQRPFRAPHHSISVAGLTGGVTFRPGEVTLAHKGVLYLDEFQEFPHMSREVLCNSVGPDGFNIHRHAGVVHFPSDAWMVASLPADAEKPTEGPFRNAVVIDLERITPNVVLSDEHRWPSTADLRARVSE